MALLLRPNLSSGEMKISTEELALMEQLLPKLETFLLAERFTVSLLE